MTLQEQGGDQSQSQQQHNGAKSPDVYHSFELAKRSFENAWRQIGLPAIQPEQMRKIKTRSFKRTREGVTQWWEAVRATLQPGQRVGVVMEVTSSFSLETAAWLAQICPDVQVSIVMGKRIRSWAESIGLNIKTDQVDARVIACFGAERRPAGYIPLGQSESTLRAILRTRLVCVEQLEANRQRLSEAKSEHLDAHTSKLLQQTLGKVMGTLEKEIEKLDREAKKIIAQDSQLAQDIEQLDRLSGVGWHSAATVRAEYGDLRRFGRGRQLTSMAGLNPVIHKSGESVERRSRISKKGSSRARRSLYLATLSTLRGDNPFSAMYNGLVQRGKKKMVAVVAVMRKMLLVMRAVLISGKPFDLNYSRANG